MLAERLITPLSFLMKSQKHHSRGKDNVFDAHRFWFNGGYQLVTHTSRLPTRTRLGLGSSHARFKRCQGISMTMFSFHFRDFFFFFFFVFRGSNILSYNAWRSLLIVLIWRKAREKVRHQSSPAAERAGALFKANPSQVEIMATLRNLELQICHRSNTAFAQRSRISDFGVEKSLPTLGEGIWSYHSYCWWRREIMRLNSWVQRPGTKPSTCPFFSIWRHLQDLELPIIGDLVICTQIVGKRSQRTR